MVRITLLLSESHCLVNELYNFETAPKCITIIQVEILIFWLFN